MTSLTHIGALADALVAGHTFPRRHDDCQRPYSSTLMIRYRRSGWSGLAERRGITVNSGA
ncbi:MAG: hypothetical protein WD651_01450 [Acidimicrobiia bacterium]